MPTTAVLLDAWGRPPLRTPPPAPITLTLVPGLGPVVPVMPSYGVPRAPGWAALAARLVRANPQCAGCGRRSEVPHHVKPFHLFPALELLETNLVVVCVPCHFVVCHLGDWVQWDPTCRTRLKDHLRRVLANRRDAAT